jgi:hypothetical protein
MRARKGGTGEGRRAVRRTARRSTQLAETDPLDAEDIALARLNAQLRKTEARPAPSPRVADALSRTTVRLPGEMLQRLRAQARREKRTLAEVVRAALDGYLKR